MNSHDGATPCCFFVCNYIIFNLIKQCLCYFHYCRLFFHLPHRFDTQHPLPNRRQIHANAGHPTSSTGTPVDRGFGIGKESRRCNRELYRNSRYSCTHSHGNRTSKQASTNVSRSRGSSKPHSGAQEPTSTNNTTASSTITVPTNTNTPMNTNSK
jgi:hypothetical protein